MHNITSKPENSKPTISGSPLIVAMDVADLKAATNLASSLDPKTCRLKVGKELFTAAGPKVVEELQKQGFDVFLDLKFHDIPNTTAQAVKVAATLGVWMVNVHSLGGLEMMQRCREILSGFSAPPLLIGVTVLTSTDSAGLALVGLERGAEAQVALLASLAKKAGLDGVVSSAREAAKVKSLCGKEFVTVTPGIRPIQSDANDQKRTMTPVEAIKNGSDYLVIGRPITQADNPSEAALTLFNEIKQL